jgi:HprK-related kinase A
MKVRLKDFNEADIRRRLKREGIGLDLGAARVRYRSDVSQAATLLRVVYGEFPLADTSHIFDVTADLRRLRGVRRFIRPQVELWIDGATEFERFPLDTSLPLLEWGVNYALAARLYCYLMLHAGAVARGSAGLLLPAMPGSGKSTLTAVLSCRGFRLLSDEFGVIRPSDGRMLPLLRPVGLKNESIGIVRAAAPAAVLGPPFPNTRKGTVAHLAPQMADVDALSQPVQPRLVIFPRYETGADLEIEELPQTRAFGRLVVNSFNYDVLGPTGFDTLADLVERTPAFDVRYGNWQDGLLAVERLFTEVTVNTVPA